MNEYVGYKPAHEVFLGRLSEVNWDTKTYVAVALTGNSGDEFYNSITMLLDEDLNTLKSFSLGGRLHSCAVSSKGDVMGVGFGPPLGYSTFFWKPFSEYTVWGRYTFIDRNALISLNGSIQSTNRVNDSQFYQGAAADRDGNFATGYLYGGAGFYWYPWWVATPPVADIFYPLIGQHQQVEKLSPKGGRLWVTPPPYGPPPGTLGDVPNRITYGWSNFAFDGEGSLYATSTNGITKFSTTGGIVWDKRLINIEGGTVCTDNNNNVYHGYRPIYWTVDLYGPHIHYRAPRVVKYNKNGGILWAKDVAGMEGNTRNPPVAVDGQRSVYISNGANIIKTPEPVPAGSKAKPATAWSVGIDSSGTAVTGLAAHKRSVFVAVHHIFEYNGIVYKYDRDTGKLLGSRSFGRGVVHLGVTQSWGPRAPPKAPPKK